MKNSSGARFPTSNSTPANASGFTLCNDPCNPRLDRDPFVDLLIEPLFKRHETRLDLRTVRQRPVVVPAEDIRITVPVSRFAIDHHIKPDTVLGVTMGAEIRQLNDKRQCLVGREVKKLQKWPTKIGRRIAFRPIGQSALRQARSRKIIVLRLLNADREENFERRIGIWP